MSGSNKDLDRYKKDLLLAKQTLSVLLEEVTGKLNEIDIDRWFSKSKKEIYNNVEQDRTKTTEELESEISLLEQNLEMLQEQLEATQKEWFESIISALKLEDYLRDFRDG